MEAERRTIRRALPADARALTALAVASKRHWGYDATFMERVRPALIASAEYVAALEKHGMIPSMSRPANPYDNASCESFLKTLKREEIYANQYSDLEHLRTNIEEFIDKYYNRQRLHSALGDRSPEEFEEQVKHSDSMTQFRSPSLEFVLRTEENISTRMPEQGTQTPSPAPDLIPG